MKHTMTPSRSEAIVAALPDGSVEVRSSLVDLGQGLPGELVRAAVEALGVPASRVRVLHPDTAVTPFDPTTSSSRGTWAGSTAVRAACADLRGRLELPADGPFPSGPDLAALVRGSGTPEVVGRGEARNEAPVDPESGVAASSSHWHQGAVGVRASVDSETGVVRVTEAFGAAWAGRVVVPDAARLQTEGGLIYGLGPALFEELGFPGGAPAVTSLFDYRIPSLPDTPRRLVTVALEANDPHAEPTGLGESVTPAVAPAVAAALAEATGLEARDLPLDPERVLRGLAALDDAPWPVESTDPGQPRSSPDAPATPAREPRVEPVDLAFTVDGRPVTVTADPLASLRDVLGDTLRLRSVREPCGVGVCGACTVLVDGRAVRSCLRPVGLAAGATIVTAEGLPPGHHVLEAFVAAGAAQCGFCIPGAVLSATDLLRRNPAPDTDAIRAGLSGNLCRCGTYGRIVDAVRAAGSRPADPS
jgi:aerobic-type carbon monoxide dehydrogenase small subunit (CoxS/CutS family)